MWDLIMVMIGAFKNSLSEITNRSHFGWNYDHDTYEGFIYRDKCYTTTGVHSVSLAERPRNILQREFQSRGTLEAWKRVPRLYHELDQKAAQLMLVAGFAAPFMKWAGNTAKNLIFSIWDSRGGKGKTTLLQTINSIWGHPETMMSKHDDTVSARYQNLSTRRNLPMCIDELTMMDDNTLAGLVLEIANGMERRKSKQHGEALAETGFWNTVTMVSSNRSIYEILMNRSAQGTAQEMRVIEIPCEFKSYSGTDWGVYIEQVLSLLSDNYGVAGDYFLRQCFQDLTVFDQVRDEAIEFDRRVRKTAEERFWTYGLGIVLAVGRRLVQWGLVNYDMDVLACYAEVLVGYSRRSVAAESKDSRAILSEFLAEQMETTLIVQTANRSRADMNAHPAIEADPYVVKAPRSVTDVRVELDTGMVYVRTKAFNTWCSRQRVSAKTVIAECQSQGLMPSYNPKLQVILGRGVLSLARVQVYALAFKDASLNPVYQEVIENAKSNPEPSTNTDAPAYEVASDE
jgi:hypothetical protein